MTEGFGSNRLIPPLEWINPELLRSASERKTAAERQGALEVRDGERGGGCCLKHTDKLEGGNVVRIVEGSVWRGRRDAARGFLGKRCRSRGDALMEFAQAERTEWSRQRG
jgi:hypothetical protein